MDDEELKEWAMQIWATVEGNPSYSVLTMKRFIQEYEKSKNAGD